MTRRRAAKLGAIFGLGVLRFAVLLALLALVGSFPVALQLFLLPAGIALIVARYVFQLPQLRWDRILKSQITPTFAAEPTRFSNARERAALLLRPPPSFPRLLLAMAIAAVLVPFAAGEVGGVCARGELIRVSSGAPVMAAHAGTVVQALAGYFVLVWFVLIEEFAFRGWLLFPVRKLLGAPAAVAITSYLFAIGHLVPAMGLNHLFAGVIFGTSAVLSGSIWSAVGLHLAYNAGVTGWDRFFDAFGAGAVSCGTSRPLFLFLTGALFYVLWMGRRRKQLSEGERNAETPAQ